MKNVLSEKKHGGKAKSLGNLSFYKMNKDRLVKKDKNSSGLEGEGDDSIPEIKNRGSLRKVLNMEEISEKH